MNRMLLSNPRVAQSVGNIAADVENVIDRFFGDRGNGDRFAGDRGNGVKALSFSPRMDICETDHAYEVAVDLPGVKSEDVQIEMREGHLTVSGTRRTVAEQEKRQYHRIERPSGAFSRTIILPRGIDHDAIEASYADGVLLVMLPKAESNQPRRIHVKTAAPTAEGSVVSSEPRSERDAESKGTARQGNAKQKKSTGV